MLLTDKLVFLMVKADSSFEAGTRALEGDESGKRFDLVQPGPNFRITGEVHIPLGRPFDIAVERNVGDGGLLRCGNPMLAFQYLFHDSERGMSALDNLLGVKGRTENGDQPGGAGAIGNFAGRH